MLETTLVRKDIEEQLERLYQMRPVRWQDSVLYYLFGEIPGKKRS